MFEGSKNANVKYLSFIEKAGANLAEGGVNGTTSEDRHQLFRDRSVREPRICSLARVGPARDA